MIGKTLLLLGLSGPELIIILFIILLLFGANKIPDLARGLGRGIREFKDASRDVQKEIEREPAKKSENPPSNTGN